MAVLPIHVPSHGVGVQEQGLLAVDLYRTTAKEDEGALTDFIIVRAGTGGSDGGEYEAIVPVEDAK